MIVKRIGFSEWIPFCAQYVEKTSTKAPPTKNMFTNGDFPEAVHVTLAKSENMHGHKTKRPLGTPVHVKVDYVQLKEIRRLKSY